MGQLPADCSLETAQQIDACCDAFEAEWVAGRGPRIEHFLAEVESPIRPLLLQALLELECEFLQRDDPFEERRLNDYLERFPDHAGLVRSVLAQTGAVIPGVIGRFEIHRVLGAGAFGTVYLARDARLERDVALKVPRGDSAQRDQVRSQWLKEARAAAALRHPNICPIYEIEESDETPFIAMSYIPGQSLASLIAQRGKFEAPDAATLIARIARALEHAHAAGVIHRDLKPANILIEEHGEPVVTDFGIAHRIDLQDDGANPRGLIVGTPAYMSPEQARGESDRVDPRSDIYSLGVILYELLTGVCPFRGSASDCLRQVIEDEPPAPSAVVPALEPEIEAICLRAIQRLPADRYPSMAKFAGALESYTAHRVPTGIDTRPISEVETDQVPPPRSSAGRRTISDGADIDATQDRHGFRLRTSSRTRTRLRHGILLIVSVTALLSAFRPQPPRRNRSADEFPAMSAAMHPLVETVPPHGDAGPQTSPSPEATGKLSDDSRLAVSASRPPASGRSIADSFRDDREVARQVLHVGGSITIRFVDGGTVPKSIAQAEQLPAVPFRIVAVSLVKVPYSETRLMPQLVGLSQLEELSLHYSGLTDAGLRLIAGSKSLRRLSLNGTRITDEGLLESIPKMQQLEKLSLDRTRVTHAGLQCVSDLPNIQVLFLNDTRTTDSGIAVLRKLKQLRYLSLLGTAVTDDALRMLSECRSLAMLDLRDTGISAATMAWFRQQRPDCRLLLREPQKQAIRKWSSIHSRTTRSPGGTLEPAE